MNRYFNYSLEDIFELFNHECGKDITIDVDSEMEIFERLDYTNEWGIIEFERFKKKALDLYGSYRVGFVDEISSNQVYIMLYNHEDPYTVDYYFSDNT